MNAWILRIAIVLFIGTLFWFVLFYTPEQVKKLEEQSCEYLLGRIQDDGMKPNYQYDVRAWIAQECWK